jgi:prepilin-type N-terminal cleavage/methylation domain-containing protein
MNRGFTLIELILVIVISSIVSIFTFSFIYNSVQTYRLMRTQSQLHQEGSYALERISRELRDASFGLDSGSGISFIKPVRSALMDPNISDRNTFVRYYRSGKSLYRCSDASFGLVCLFNPSSSPTNKPISANISTFAVLHNTNGECNPSDLPGCQDDSFSITLGLTRDGQTFTIATTITPKNYCAEGASAASCSTQDYTNRSFNRDYRDVVN